MKQKGIPLKLKGIEARIIYQNYKGFEVKSLLLSLGEKRDVLSTREGYKKVSFVVNHYNPRSLWDRMHQHYEEFEKWIPSALGISLEELGVCPSNRWVTGNKRGKLRLRERNDTVLSGI